MSVASAEAPMDLDTPRTVSVLTETFERVLQCGSVRPEDDFFELGGDSIMAVALTAEIEEVTGVRLPTTALFDAPTVASLAAMLDSRERERPPSSIVQLKPGGKGPALFITPGVSGSAIDLLPLARATLAPGPVYGLRAPGLAESETRLDRIETMVEHYLPLIRGVQPHGPYFLAGYSMGGLTALELARSLTEAGESVPLVAMLDTIIHPKDLPLRTKARIWGRRVRHHARNLRGLTLLDSIPYIAGRIPGLLYDLGAGEGRRAQERQEQMSSVPAATQRVIEGGFIACAHYRQRFFPGTITFVQAVDNHDLPTHPDIIWGKVAGKLVVRPVKGDHLNMIAHHAEALADILSDCIHCTMRAI